MQMTLVRREQTVLWELLSYWGLLLGRGDRLKVVCGLKVFSIVKKEEQCQGFFQRVL